MNKMIVTILTMIIQFPLIGQEIVQQDGYYDIKNGIYETKSLEKELIGNKPNVIQPQTEFITGDKTAFIKVKEKEIALFDRINDKGTTKPVGVLTKTSVIQVDTIFYKEIFKDTNKGGSLTFNVWYAISINDQKFYTDYKIHDDIAFQEKLPKYNQEFLLVSQNTGYDEYYDNGYPNNFFIVILNGENEVIYESKLLDFDYGYEFWDNELKNSVSTAMTNKGFEFVLNGHEDKFKGIWTGKKLKK